jgi:hypothetical protein
MLVSDEYLTRRFGWDAVWLAYPEVAKRIGDYDPRESPVACHSKVERRAHRPWWIGLAAAEGPFPLSRARDEVRLALDPSGDTGTTVSDEKSRRDD